MGRLLTSCQLPLRWSREGHLILSAARIVQGIGFILGSVLWAGMWVVMFLDEPTSSQSHLRAPFGFVLSPSASPVLG
jgi:hypothetical protein